MAVGVLWRASQTNEQRPFHSHELVKRARRIGDVDPQYKAYVQASAPMRRAIFRWRVRWRLTGNERERDELECGERECMREGRRHRRDV